MYSYYQEHLSGHHLRQVYESAPARIRQYLRAEFDHVLEWIRPGDRVLELGCGYGRILPQLAARAGLVVGIDNSAQSLFDGRQDLARLANCHLACMDALHLGFQDRTFDCVVCIQNGISAFHVDQAELVREAVRVAGLGGLVLFSTYADRFWEDRLEWFRLQSQAGLVGEIDYQQTRRGTIVCKDGFTATTVGPEKFLSLARGLHVKTDLVEVDESSLFLELRRTG